MTVLFSHGFSPIRGRKIPLWLIGMCISVGRSGFMQTSVDVIIYPNFPLSHSVVWYAIVYICLINYRKQYGDMIRIHRCYGARLLPTVHGP